VECCGSCFSRNVHATFMQPLVVFTVPLQRRMLPLGIHDAGHDKGVRNFCPLGKHHWSASRNSSMMTRFKIVSPMERRVYRRQQTQLSLRSFEAARPRRKVWTLQASSDQFLRQYCDRTCKDRSIPLLPQSVAGSTTDLVAY
jgi:hypothetical protein